MGQAQGRLTGPRPQNGWVVRSLSLGAQLKLCGVRPRPGSSPKWCVAPQEMGARGKAGSVPLGCPAPLPKPGEGRGRSRSRSRQEKGGREARKRWEREGPGRGRAGNGVWQEQERGVTRAGRGRAGNGVWQGRKEA